MSNMSNDHPPPEPCKKRELQIYEFLNDLFLFSHAKLVWTWNFTPLSSKRIFRGFGFHQKKNKHLDLCPPKKMWQFSSFRLVCVMFVRWSSVELESPFIGWKAASKCCFKHSALGRLDRSQSHHPTSKPSGKLCLPASSRRFVEKLISQMVSHFIHVYI